MANGHKGLLYYLQAANETVDAAWALAITALAVVGGFTRSLGNRLTLILGLIGGLAFALASATISELDPL